MTDKEKWDILLLAAAIGNFLFVAVTALVLLVEFLRGG